MKFKIFFFLLLIVLESAYTLNKKTYTKKIKKIKIEKGSDKKNTSSYYFILLSILIILLTLISILAMVVLIITTLKERNPEVLETKDELTDLLRLQHLLKHTNIV